MQKAGRWWQRAAEPTISVVALVVLVVLSMIAKERKYDMTSAGLLVLTGVLGAWLAALIFKLG